MKIIEALLAIALFGIAIYGAISHVENEISRSQADGVRRDALAFQEAVIAHQRQYPFDAIHDWGDDFSTDPRHFAKIARFLPERFTQRTINDNTVVVPVSTDAGSFAGFGMSPYGSPYRAEIRPNPTGRRLHFVTPIVGISDAQRVADAFLGFDAAVTPPPEEGVHDETTNFEFDVRILPSIKQLITSAGSHGQGASYTRDPVTGDPILTGMLTPLTFAGDQYAPAAYYPDGIAYGGRCPEDFPSLVTVSATGQMLYCTEDPFGVWRWKPLVPQDQIASWECYGDRQIAPAPTADPTQPNGELRIYSLPTAPVHSPMATHACHTAPTYWDHDSISATPLVFRNVSVYYAGGDALCASLGLPSVPLPIGHTEYTDAQKRALFDPVLPPSARAGGSAPAVQVEIRDASETAFRCECRSDGELVGTLATEGVTEYITGGRFAVSSRISTRDGYDEILNVDVGYTTSIDGMCAAETVSVFEHTVGCASGDLVVVDTEVYEDATDPHDDHRLDYQTCTSGPATCPDGYQLDSGICELHDPTQIVSRAPFAPHYSRFGINDPIPGDPVRNFTFTLYPATYASPGYTCGDGITRSSRITCPDPFTVPAHFLFDPPPSGNIELDALHIEGSAYQGQPASGNAPGTRFIHSGPASGIGGERSTFASRSADPNIPPTDAPEWHSLSACPTGYFSKPSIKLGASNAIEACEPPPGGVLIAPGATGINSTNAGATPIPSDPRCPSGFTLDGGVAQGYGSVCQHSYRARRIAHTGAWPDCPPGEAAARNAFGTWCPSETDDPCAIDPCAAGCPAYPCPPPPPVALVTTCTSMNVDEGDHQECGVRLSSQPSSAVTLSGGWRTGSAIASSSAQVSHSRTRFTTSNWDTDIIVTATAHEDTNTVNESGTWRLTTSGGSTDTANIAVTTIDNDRPTELVVSCTSVTVNEGTTDTSCRVTLNQAPAAPVTLAGAWVTGAEIAPASASVALGGNTLNAANWNTGNTINVTAHDDVNTDNETGTWQLTASGGVTDTADIGIDTIDDDLLKCLANPSHLTVEEGDTITFEGTLNTQPTSSVTVNFSLSGVGSGSISPTSHTFTPSTWDDPVTVTITTIADADSVDNTGYTHCRSVEADDATVVVEIIEPCTLSTDPSQTIAEGETSRVPLEVSYSGSGTESISVASGDPSRIDIHIASPFDMAVPGRIQVPFSSLFDSDNIQGPPVDITFTGCGASVTHGVTITENALAVSPAAITVNEGDTANWTLSASSPPVSPITVNLTTTDPGGAVEAPGPATPVILTSGNYTGAPLGLNTTVDPDCEDESIVVTHDDSIGVYGSAPVTITVVDTSTCAGPSIEFATPGGSFDEGLNPSIAVTATPAATTPLTVGFSLGGTATSGNDYSLVTTSIPVTGAGGSLPISLICDSAEPAEGDETMEITLSGGPDYSLGANKTFTLTIGDVCHQIKPSVEFATTTGTYAEGVVPTISVTATPATTVPMDVGFAIGLASTADSGDDFTITQGAITVDGASGALNVSLVCDNITEGAETLELSLTADPSYTLGSNTSFTLTIDDVCQAIIPDPVIEFVGTSGTEDEGFPADIDVSATPAATTPLNVGFSVAGTATRGSDYTIAASHINVAGNSGALRIPLKCDDTLPQEGAETIVVTLNSGVGYTLGSNTTHTLTVVDVCYDRNPPPSIPATIVPRGAVSYCAMLRWAQTYDTSGLSLSDQGTGGGASVSILCGGIPNNVPESDPTPCLEATYRGIGAPWGWSRQRNHNRFSRGAWITDSVAGATTPPLSSNFNNNHPADHCSIPLGHGNNASVRHVGPPSTIQTAFPANCPNATDAYVDTTIAVSVAECQTLYSNPYRCLVPTVPRRVCCPSGHTPLQDGDTWVCRTGTTSRDMSFSLFREAYAQTPPTIPHQINVVAPPTVQIPAAVPLSSTPVHSITDFITLVSPPGKRARYDLRDGTSAPVWTAFESEGCVEGILDTERGYCLLEASTPAGEPYRKTGYTDIPVVSGTGEP